MKYLTTIRRQINLLRKFIEDDANDIIERRVAQIMEDTLRWATEDTTWANPADDLGMADIIKRDFGKEKVSQKGLPFSLSCVGCDAGMDIHSEEDALSQGWIEIQLDDGANYNYSGICPYCLEQEELAKTGKNAWPENQTKGKGEGVTQRTRPERLVTAGLILERQDGECIDLGEIPDFSSFPEVLGFLYRLMQIDYGSQSYSLGRVEWTPSQLEFRIDDPVK